MKLKDEPPQRISLEQYNKELEEAGQDMNSGQFISQEEAKRRSGSSF